MPLFKLSGGGTVTSVGLTAPSIFAVTGSPVTTAGVLALALVTQAANLVWAGPATGAAADPTFRALVAADIPDLSGVYQPLNAKLTAISALANAAGVLTNNGSGVFSYTTPATGTVTSVAMTVPSFLSVAGSPITTAGTFAVSLANQNANLVFAGPGTGAAAAPTFRALVAADIPDLSGTYQPLNAKLTAISALANASGVLTNNGSGGFSYTTPSTGTVTSVALTVPSFLSVAGSPITTSGTFAVTLGTQSANLVFAGPSSGGASTPTFRSLVALDIPDLSATYQPLNAKLTAISALANASGVLTNNGSGGFSYTTPATGTVTSVAMTVPSFLSVAGSPVTTTGTLAVTLATETANTVFAGPTSGGAATPTFRALVAADFASIPAATFTMATARILGRTTAGTGAVEELTAGTSLSLSSGSLNTIQDIRTSATPTWVGVNGTTTLLLKTGGTTAVTIDSSQHVGIGGSPDTLFLLDVIGSTAATNTRVVTSAGNGIELQASASPGIVAQNRGAATYQSLFYQAADHAWFASTTLRMSLSSTGLLVVNANSASAPSPLSGTIFQVVGADSTTARMGIDAFAATPVLNLRRANGTNASKSAVVLDDQIGAVAALGYGTSDYPTGGRANLIFLAAENWTNTAQGTYIAFYTTATGGTTNAEKMRLDAAGNLGLGVTSLSAKFTSSKNNGGATTGAANAAIYLPEDESTIQGSGTSTQIRMGGNLVLGGNGSMFLQTGGANRISLDGNGNCILGTGALATSTTNGFLYIAGGPGTPSGTPTSATGRYPLYYDSSANKLWIYNGSWRGVVVT